jgi:lysophospholipase L1-like esterase
MEQIIARMRLTAAARRVPLLLVLIPSPIDVADEHETGEVDVVRHPAYRRSALTDIVEQICRRTHVPAVNLFAPFQQRGARELYMKGEDDHWNERGQDLAAELVSEFVAAQGLLKGPACCSTEK